MSSNTQASDRSEDGKPSLVPKLRFPEFRGARGWHTYLLEELEELGWVELGRGDVISSEDIKAIPGEHPIYSSSVKNNGYMGSYGRFIFDEELISWSVDGGGDFFYRPRHKFSVTNVSGYMRLDTTHLNYRFTASQLQALHASLTFDYQFKAHPSVIRKLYRLAIAGIPEQQKIADCLSSLDGLIAAQARKLDALKTHKIGLMQQLFPREGETQPRLRFPEFQNAGDWNQKTLGALCRIRTGKKDANEGAADGAYPFFTCAEKHIHSHSYSFDAEAILIAGNATVGQAHYYNGRFEAYQRTYVLTDFRDILVSYLYSVLSANLRSDMLAQVQTSAMSYIRLPMLEEYQIIAPPTLPEQQRIADCLTSLDDLITAQTQKIESLKTHKKGLMQQLFPSPEEVEA